MHFLTDIQRQRPAAVPPEQLPEAGPLLKSHQRGFGHAQHWQQPKPHLLLAKHGKVSGVRATDIEPAAVTLTINIGDYASFSMQQLHL